MEGLTHRYVLVGHTITAAFDNTCQFSDLPTNCDTSFEFWSKVETYSKQIMMIDSRS